MASDSEHSSSDQELLFSQETFQELQENIGVNGSFSNLFQLVDSEVDKSKAVVSITSGKNPENQVELEIKTAFVDENQEIDEKYTGVREYNLGLSTNSQAAGQENFSYANMNAPAVQWCTDNSQPIQPSAPVAPAAPATNNWEGDYGFTVSCEPHEKLTKSTNWTYAEDLDKLYVNVNVVCPFRVYMKSTPPFGSFIRATAVFTQPQFANDIVYRCVNHSNPSDETNKNSPAPPTHLIRCTHPHTTYVEDSTTGRHSVCVSYMAPPAGVEYSTYHIKFMCLGSCVGGLNRRPIKVAFTLENGNTVLGRKSMDVRICACPGRDRKADEKEKSSNTPQSRIRPTKREPLTGIADIFSIVPSAKKFKQEKNDGETYQITVRNREIYDILKKIKDALELMVAVSEHPNLRTAGQEELLSRSGSALANELLRSSRLRRQNSKSDKESSSFVKKEKEDLPTTSCSHQENVSTVNIEDCVDSHIGKPTGTKNEDKDPRSLVSERGTSENSGSEYVKSWLQSINMSAYVDDFLKRGFHTVEDLQKITLKDLNDMNIGSGHKKKIWSSILSLEEEDFTLQEEFEKPEGGPSIPASQESLRSLSQTSQCSSTSARRLQITHVRVKHTFNIKEEHNYFSSEQQEDSS